MLGISPKTVYSKTNFYPTKKNNTAVATQGKEDKKEPKAKNKKFYTGLAILGATIAAGLLLMRKSKLSSNQTKSVIEDFINQSKKSGKVKEINLSDYSEELKNISKQKISAQTVERTVAKNAGAKELSTNIDYDYLSQVDKEMYYKNYAEKSKLIVEHFEQKAQALEQRLATPNLAVEEIQDILAQKTAFEHAAKNITQNHDPFLSRSSWQLNLATGETVFMKDLEKGLESEIELFKKKGIMSLSDLKEAQLDAEAVMQKYRDRANKIRRDEIDRKFNPMRRLKPNIPGYCDPFLNERHPEFYRIISPKELVNLLKTQKTGNYITANGYHTNGNYSCITANPNYHEQMFGANGLPIRLKFKTMNPDKTFNMDLLDRIGGIKEERSIYGIHGYNFYDIDWNNVCVPSRNGRWTNCSLSALRDYLKI